MSGDVNSSPSIVSARDPCQPLPKLPPEVTQSQALTPVGANARRPTFAEWQGAVSQAASCTLPTIPLNPWRARGGVGEGIRRGPLNAAWVCTPIRSSHPRGPPPDTLRLSQGASLACLESPFFQSQVQDCLLQEALRSAGSALLVRDPLRSSPTPRLAPSLLSRPRRRGLRTRFVAPGLESLQDPRRAPALTAGRQGLTSVQSQQEPQSHASAPHSAD